MVSPQSVIKSAGPKLVPFFKTLAVYFVLTVPDDWSRWLAAVLKCLPIASLVVFVLLHGINMNHEYVYARRVVLGLCCCMAGDALLVLPDHFLHGMAAFGVGHGFYVSAFGLQPLRPALGALLYSLGAVSLSLLLPSASGAMLLGLPLYTGLLLTMTWRALARFQHSLDATSWTVMSSGFGAVCFLVSDALIGLRVFYGLPQLESLVMPLYYAGQLGITLSIVDSHCCRPAVGDGLHGDQISASAVVG